MHIQIMYFLLCAFVCAGGYLACFYFAKKDRAGYAFASFLIASSAGAAATKLIYDNPQGRFQQQNASTASP